MNDSEKVRIFFERWAGDFDRYYDEETKNILSKALDFIFRQSIKERFRLTLEECAREKDFSLLDVGCGSGRYCVALAQKGARNIAGIDFSPAMVAIADRLAQRAHLENKCRFITQDFLNTDFTETFDVVLAMGVFDYTAEPWIYLEKMKRLTRRKIIASFPAKWRLRNVIRVPRLKILDCPLYFYTPATIARAFQRAGISNFTIKNIGRDYFVIARLS